MGNHTRRAFGRLPADPTKPKLRLRRSKSQAVTPPESCDWLSQVGEWTMAFRRGLTAQFVQLQVLAVAPLGQLRLVALDLG